MVKMVKVVKKVKVAKSAKAVKPNRGGEAATPVKTVEPPLSVDVAARRKGLRTGWTTGTCASAAAKAAALRLTTGSVPKSVEVALPAGRRVNFEVNAVDDVETQLSAPLVERSYSCSVIKDAGDDPDCTNGAHVTATVYWAEPAATESILLAGPGVGTVTLPGLGLPVGAPAINPVPRRMIFASVKEVTSRPLVITISVPGGKEMAAKTSNARLGIVGGISILGTTGIVRPFSTAAYRASVVQQIDVAAAQGETIIILATGSRSEQAAMREMPKVAKVCFVEVGDFTGIALRHANKLGIQKVIFVGMVGKISKLASGIMMTHFHRSKVDSQLLADVARQTGASRTVIEGATATNTARHFYELCIAENALAPLEHLCQLAKAACISHAGGKMTVDIIMVDFEGDHVIARA